MKGLLQLVYEVAVRELELPFKYIGFIDTKTELRKTKREPLYHKPVLWLDHAPLLIIGVQKHKNGLEYFQSLDNMYALPIKDEHLAIRKARIEIDFGYITNKSYIRKLDNNLFILDSNIYNTDYYDISFFDKILALSRKQYVDRIDLLLYDSIISSCRR